LQQWRSISFFRWLPAAESDHSTFCPGWRSWPFWEPWWQGSIWLRSAGQHLVAIVLLLLLAVPGALYVLFLLLILIIPSRLSVTRCAEINRADPLLRGEI
jgi:hypothetical protein